MSSARRRMRYTALGLVLGTAMAAGFAGAETPPSCPAPRIDAPTFSRGGEVPVTWSYPAPAPETTLVEVSHSPETAEDGTFTTAGPPAIVASDRAGFRFEGLDGAVHYFHARGASERCTGAWSGIVAVVQDDTGPEVVIDTPPDPRAVRDAPVIEGTAVDLPGHGAPYGSGAVSVTLSVDNTTPLLGGLSEPIDDVSVAVDPDGTWRTTLEGLGPGTYRVSAEASDVVGNRTENPPSVDILVV